MRRFLLNKKKENPRGLQSTQAKKKISHKGHKGREDHKEEEEVFVRYLIVKFTHSLRTTIPSSPL